MLQDVFVGFATVPGYVSLTSSGGSPYLQVNYGFMAFLQPAEIHLEVYYSEFLNLCHNTVVQRITAINTFLTNTPTVFLPVVKMVTSRKLRLKL